MRKDFYLINDAGSWSVVTTSALDDIINSSNDEVFVNAYKAALFMIEGDDYSVIRVVTNEPLKENEEKEWISRASWRLNFSQGKIIVSAGFDPDVFREWKKENGQEDANERGYVQEIDVAPGDYQVVFYSYLHSINGAIWLSDFYEKMGMERLLPKPEVWFRKDHPNCAIPTWLAAQLAHEKFDKDDEWAPSFAEAVKTGRIKVEKEPVHWVGYLIHITPFIEGTQLDTHEEGWFSSTTGLRTPDSFPLGVSTSCTKDSQVKSTLDYLFKV